MLRTFAKISFLLVAVALIASGLFSAGYVFGKNSVALPEKTLEVGATPQPLPEESPSQSPTALPIKETGTPENLQEVFAPFWEAWNLVHQEYVDQPVDDVKLSEGAIRGMMEALGDPHSSYMNPDEYRLANSDLAGELEGIGAEVDVSGDLVKIISPLPGSPAEESGILPGDIILKVNGEDMTGVAGFSVVLKVRGPAGSTVHLTILREGVAEPLEFDIVRKKITIASVESKMLGPDIAYVKLNNFGDKTSAELRDALKAQMSLKPKGLILDLRGNPGGYLTTAIDVASEFIPDGTVMLQQFGDGREETYTASGKGLALQVPLVVLINAGSASASEIVAGAIQDRGRGILIGETSYGKGSVQNWNALKDNQGAVRITIARWLTPDGRQISGKGITPDREVPLTDEDRAAGRDPQLDAALDFLTGKTGAEIPPSRMRVLLVGI